MSKNRATKQLFHPVREMELLGYYAFGRLLTMEGSNMPHICWPSGAPCLLANLYMLRLRERRGRSGRQGLSRRGVKCGTLGDYAGKVSQLIRFCYQNGWDFQDLTDDKFSLFVVGLRAQRADHNFRVRKKNEQTITAVGRVCLDFLWFVGEFHDDSEFVAENGCVRGYRKEHQIRDGRGKVVRRVAYWHHHTFSSGDRLRSRSSITGENIERLYEAVYRIPSSRFVRTRRQCQLSLLEHVGLRVGELAEMRVKDVLEADVMADPLLRLVTLKREEGAHRYVPVSRMLLSELKKYIRVQRRIVISRKLGAAPDHGYVFISETTGEKLLETTLSAEVYVIRKAAGIEEQACAQMFRHAFITNLFVLLIERHELENPDAFRRALLNDEDLKEEVRQWTGHTVLASLDHYIHRAFARVAGYYKTTRSVRFIRVMQVFDQRLLRLTQGLLAGMTAQEFSGELQSLLHSRDADLSALDAVSK